MKRRLLGVLVVVVTLGPAVGAFSAELFAQSASAARTDAQIKDEIVRLSIASYSGSCPVSVQPRSRGEELWEAKRLQPPRRGVAAVLRRGCDREDGGGLSGEE